MFGMDWNNNETEDLLDDLITADLLGVFEEEDPEEEEEQEESDISDFNHSNEP